MAKTLRFLLVPEAASRPQIGRVHSDGTITFNGRRYSTLREVPTGCKGLPVRLAWWTSVASASARATCVDLELLRIPWINLLEFSQ